MKTQKRTRKRNHQAAPESAALSQTVTRAIAILRAFSRDKTELGVTELSAQLGLSKTIVFRLAQTLMKYDLLERDAGSVRYRIGFGAFEIGLLFKKAVLDREAEPHMRALVEKTGLTSQLAVFHRNRMVIVASEEATAPLRYSVAVGETRALHSSAVGKAALSTFDDARVASILAECGMPKRTSKTITNLRKLKTDLAQVRQRGYAVNWQENTVGVASLAAPIPSRQLTAPAVISLAFPVSHVDRKQIPSIGKLLKAAAESIGARL
jgi:IclR family acetate operon transcriptional repressor